MKICLFIALALMMSGCLGQHDQQNTVTVNSQPERVSTTEADLVETKDELPFYELKEISSSENQVRHFENSFGTVVIELVIDPDSEDQAYVIPGQFSFKIVASSETALQRRITLVLYNQMRRATRLEALRSRAHKNPELCGAVYRDHYKGNSIGIYDRHKNIPDIVSSVYDILSAQVLVFSYMQLYDPTAWMLYKRAAEQGLPTEPIFEQALTAAIEQL